MQKAYVTLILAVLSLLIAPTDSLSCEGAVDLYNQGVAAEEDRKELLYIRALEAPCDDPCIVAKIYNNLGDTYESQGILEKALQQYLKAIDLCPTLATPYLGAGDVYFHMGRMGEARTYHDKGFLLKSHRSREDIIAALDPERRLRAIMVVPKAGIAKLPAIPQINLYFGFDHAQIRPEAEPQLRELLPALNDQALFTYRFRIAGHTCSLGNKGYNQGLSERRAREVQDWLIRSGVSSERLVSVGYGETRPIADNDTEAMRRLNRRVELRTIGTVVPMTRNAAAGIIEAHDLLKEGENLLSLEQYDEAVSKLEKVLGAFRADRNEPGIQAALKDLALASIARGDMEKATFYWRQIGR